MVPMRDGVHLAADVYRPARAGAFVDTPLPALLERTPYSKDASDRVEANGIWYAERGYAVVLQDVRGRYRSEGTFSFLTQEPADGYDTIEWMARQPWCNGKVGTLGLSYAGWTQVTAAALNPPHLAAMWVDEAGANARTSTVRHNGAFEMRFLCWAFWQGAKSREAKADPALERALGAVNVRDWLTRMPLKRGASPLALLPAYEEWAFAIASRGDDDDDRAVQLFDRERLGEQRHQLERVEGVAHQLRSGGHHHERRPIPDGPPGSQHRGARAGRHLFVGDDQVEGAVSRELVE